MILAQITVNWMSIFPEAATLLFLGVFLSVLVRVLRAPKQEMRSYANMPLDETGPKTEAAKDTKGEK